MGFDLYTSVIRRRKAQVSGILRGYLDTIVRYFYTPDRKVRMELTFQFQVYISVITDRIYGVDATSKLSYLLHIVLGDDGLHTATYLCGCEGGK